MRASKGLWVLGIVLGVAWSGCSRQDPRPMRPLPAEFLAVGLDGKQLTPAALQGRPWVLNFWIPG